MSQAGVINNSSGGGVVTSVTGTHGVTAAPTTGAVVVSGVNATTSTVGVASFNPIEFSVDGSGQVSLIIPQPFAWTDVSGAFVSAPSNGYFVIAAATTTLPVGAQGNTIEYILDTNAPNAFVMTAGPGQTIRIGTSISSVNGTATSNGIGSTVELIFRAADSTWIAGDNNGSWTLA